MKRPQNKYHRYRLDDLPYDKTPRRDEFWFPEHVTPWYFLNGYQKLPLQVRRRYNQLYALGNHEAFIGLEREFIAPILCDILSKQALPEELKQELYFFVEEEAKHAKMFQKINQAAEPHFYLKSDFYISNMAAKRTLWLFKKIADHYRFFGVWIWIAIFFEERSVMYSKEYLRAKSGEKRQQCCDLFVQAHHFHFLEEVYHLQLDEELIAKFYAPLNPFKKWLAAKILKSLVESYMAPRKLSISIAKILKSEFADPKIHQAIDNCMQELPSLKKNRAFLEQSFGTDATKRFRRLLSKFPEMSVVHDLIWR